MTMRISPIREQAPTTARMLATALAFTGILWWMLPGAAEARPPAEESASGSSSVDIERLERKLRSASERLGGVDRIAEPEAATPSEVLDTISGEPSAERLFEWVRDAIAFEPYDGALRSPREVLAVGAANSVDQARLLAALYDDADVEYRWAIGTFGEVAAVAVLQEFVGRAPAASEEHGGGGALLSESPAYGADRYVELLDDHVWLEVRTEGDAYRPADPSTGSQFGRTRARPRDRFSQFPERLRAELRAALIASFDDASDRRLLTIEGPLEEFAYRPIAIEFERSGVGRRSLVPRIEMSGRSRTGERFLPGEVTSMRLTYDASWGRHEAYFRQVTFLRGEEASRAFRHRSAALSAVVVPGWASASRIANRAEERLGSRLSSLRDRLGEGADRRGASEATIEELVSATVTASALAYPLRSDALTQRLAEAMGVRPVALQPRIVHAVGAREARGIAVEIGVEGGDLTAVPRRGVSRHAAQGFRTVRGVAIDAMRAKFDSGIEGSPTVTLQQIMRHARAADIPVVSLHPDNDGFVDRLDVEPRVRRRMRRSISSAGRVVLAPSRPVEIDGRSVFGWWSADPNTGALRGRYGGRITGMFDRAGGADGPIDGSRLERSVRSLAESLRNEGSYAEAVCGGLPQLRFVGRSMCAGPESRPLPTVSSCREGTNSAAQEQTSEIGVVGLRPSSCRERAAQLRCGASAAQTLFGGGTVPRLSPDEGERASGLPGRSLPTSDAALTCSGS